MIQQTRSLRDIALACSLKQQRGGFTGACPSCGYPTGFEAKESQGTILLYCHAGGCSFEQIADSLKSKGVWGPASNDSISQYTPAKAAKVAKAPQGLELASCYSLAKTAKEPEKRAETQAFIEALWMQSQPAHGALVQVYLQGRGISGPIPESIRFLPHAKHTPTGGYFPAMLAKVTPWEGSPLVAVHRTFLNPDGTGKIDHPQSKMILGPVQGCAVHLAPAGEQLAIAEGLETALSVWQATGKPTWAALSCGGIQGLVLPPLPRAQAVWIFADNDTPGLSAANQAADRWTLQGRVVKIVTPPQVGQDFNDLLQGGGYGE